MLYHHSSQSVSFASHFCVHIHITIDSLFEFLSDQLDTTPKYRYYVFFFLFDKIKQNDSRIEREKMKSSVSNPHL